jgi:alpha-L-fucosidase
MPRRYRNPGVFLLALIALGTAAGGQTPDVPPHGAIPTPQQLGWHERTFYAFVHFNMNTFTGVEWGHGTETPDTFQPTELDCDQWCSLFAECGLSGVIITAKHHDGFCLWPSEFTEHDVASSSWKEGQGDVVRELADACERHGLWLGIYISPWDRNNPIYGRDDDAYNRYFIGQMEELLGGYGEVLEVWWDGANGDRNNPDKHQEYDWKEFVATVTRLQPKAVIFAPPTAGATVRWIGNEAGYAGSTQWATFERGRGEHQPTLNTGVEGAEEWIPGEVDVSIRPAWYWSPESDERVHSIEKLLDVWYGSVGHNANLLLNFPVDNRGLVHENDAAALRELTTILKATFDVDLALGKPVQASSVRGSDPRFAGHLVADGDDGTFWATDDAVTSGSVTIDLGTPTVFNRLVAREHIELGQRVRGWNVEARVDGEWRRLFEGTTIGHRRIAAFETVVADAVRVSITDSRACPTIETISVHIAPAKVTIRPDARVFLGKTEVELEADQPGCALHYTLDGTAPTVNSPRYEEPFIVSRSCPVRAIAARDGVPSPHEARMELTAYTHDSLRTAMSFFRQPDAGLRVERYEGGWQTLDQLEGREPVSRGTCTTFDIAERSRDEHAALAFHGFIKVPEDGLYEFFCASDDGSRLYIGEKLLVENDGRHGMIERSGVIGLKQGYHPIRIEWFNATGGLGLEVRWSGPGWSREEIPPGVLAR